MPHHSQTNSQGVPPHPHALPQAFQLLRNLDHQAADIIKARLHGCVDIERFLSKETRHIDPHHPSMCYQPRRGRAAALPIEKAQLPTISPVPRIANCLTSIYMLQIHAVDPGLTGFLSPGEMRETF
jgi:hypothetical protein